MDYKVIIEMAKWFIIRQIEKFVKEIDWNKVAEDFVERVVKMVPKAVFGDVERVNTMAYIKDFGKAYEARGIGELYGTQGFIGAFQECFGDTDSAKLKAGHTAYLSSLMPVEKKVAKKEEVAEFKPAEEEKKGIFSKKGSKKTAKA